jgi:hypothetical protein
VRKRGPFFSITKGVSAMTQTELFPAAEITSAADRLPNTVSEAVASGYRRPCGQNPFPWSSTLWEAFNLGQYLRGRGLAPEGFRKSHGSKYLNSNGLIVEYHYDRHG